jgi:hypothetical protein
LPDVQYTDSEFLDEIRSKTQAILKRTFPESFQKQQIRTDSNGLVFACPYCHDSATNVSKKRGHLLLNGKWSGYFKCFNCGHFVNIPKFMTDFNEDMTIAGIKYVQDPKQNIETFNAASAEIRADIFQKSNALKCSLDREQFKTMFNLSEINTEYKNVKAYNYLIGRAQYDLRKFLYDPQTSYVLILNLVDDRIIGLQMRSLAKDCPKDKRFLTFTLEKIYKRFMRSTLTIPPELDTLSTLFGIYAVNVYKPVIVTEGPMDSFLLPNSVATAGANKHLSVELPFWYMYDSDKTGKQHAIEKLQAGQKVFLWGKFKQSIGLPRRDKWDVNDVVLWCRQNKPQDFRINWLDYFSDNKLDMIFLDSLSGII